MNLIQKLAGTSWGADVSTLRTAALALVFSTSEYCCSSWLNSSHSFKVDSQLNAAMRLVSGTLKSTPTSWLPVLCNIFPPHLRRKNVLKKCWDKYHLFPEDFPIMDILSSPPVQRLSSRKPIWSCNFLRSNFVIHEQWKIEWNDVNVFNKFLIDDPSKRVPGFDLPRRVWCSLNRLRTGHGRCNDMLFKWGALDSPECICGFANETIQHLVVDCPVSKFKDGFLGIHMVSDTFLNWIELLKDI